MRISATLITDPSCFTMTPGQCRGPIFANFVATPGATNIDMLVYASAVILLVPNDHCTENSSAMPPMVSINVPSLILSDQSSAASVFYSRSP